MTIQQKIANITQRLGSFKGIIWFLALFLLFDFIWKLSVHQGENERILLIFGKDLTSYTYDFCVWTAKTTHWAVYTLFGHTNFKIDGITIFFENSLHVDIIWGCTGLKQLFMFSFIIAFYFGPIKKKLWYIPMSLIILIIINILRLSLIMLIIKDPYPDWFIGFNQWYNGKVWDDSIVTYWNFYEDWFHLFHRDVFTWVYYDGVIFILWLIWEEKINKKHKKTEYEKTPTLVSEE